MATRIVFLVIALALVGLAVWAYRHDVELAKQSQRIELGDPNESVRDLLGEPSSEGSCGRVSPAPSGCANEYIYRYYYTVFQPQYEVVWFNAEERVIGMQHIQKLF